MGGSASQSTPSRPQPSYAKSRDAETLKWIGEHPWAKPSNITDKFGASAPTYDWVNKNTMNAPGMYSQARADKYGQAFSNWGMFAKPEVPSWNPKQTRHKEYYHHGYGVDKDGINPVSLGSGFNWVNDPLPPNPYTGIDYGILNTPPTPLDESGYIPLAEGQETIVKGGLAQARQEWRQQKQNAPYFQALTYNQMAKDLMNPDLGYGPKNPYNTMIGLDIMEKGIPDPGQRPVSQMFGTGNPYNQMAKDMFTYMPGVGGL